MFSRSRRPDRPAAIVLCALLLCAAIATVAAGTARAAQFKMVTCAGNTGAAPYGTETSSNSLFQFGNYCGGQGGDPPGSSAFLRINETQGSGNAAQGAYGRMVFATPAYVHFKAAGAYTREPNAFNAGWLARFRVTDFSGNMTTLLNQGSGLPNSGINYATTGVFAPHLWPFGGSLDFHHFYFELMCNLPGGCDRANYNAVDANAFVFILNDDQASEVYFTNKTSSLMKGEWAKGPQWMSWYTHDNGSGLRNERIRVDGAQRYLIDHQALAQCNPTSSASNGEFARSYEPCPHGPYDHSWTLDTTGIADGSHQLSVCTQDYGQYQGLNGTGGETCDSRTIRTDNTAPGKPAALEVTSSNPARYLDRFGAKFSLPPNSGSPISRVHYYVTDDEDGGKTVVPENVVTAANPTSLTDIEGPASAGAYTLHVAIEDQVGFVGPFASASVPHDTIPPAAPQNLHVLGATAHRVPAFGVQWSNIADAGSPINAAHYQVIDGEGGAVGPVQVASGESIEAIHNIVTPPQTGDLRVRVWLTDAERNIGVATTVPVPRDATPPAAPQDLSIAAPSSSRASQGFDLRWRNIVDDGSPINAAHYKVIDDAGGVVVPSTTITGDNIERIADLDTPRARGSYTLVLWLSDAEGNTGAPITAPLAYSCTRADDSSGSTLTANVGKRGTNILLRQGHGTMLGGSVGGGSSSHVNVPICVFSRVLTDDEDDFIGVALTNPNGSYRFSIPAGPSRELTAVYRPGQRQLTAQAIVRTKVRPSFRLVRKVVRNKGFAIFKTAIPGPRKKNVVILLQVKSGKAWRVFRRCHTRASGQCLLRYRFTQTATPTVFIMRAQVRAQSGYPYQQGSSKARRLRVVPTASRARLAMR